MGGFDLGSALNSITAPFTNALGIEGGIGGMFGLLSGQTGLQMSQEQFNTSLNWEKEKFDREIELANTAHQREMEDLKAAGINPLLGLGGNGANTPSVGGVSPINMNNAGAGLRDMVFSSLGTVLDLQRQSKENELIGQQIENLKTDQGYKIFRQMVEEMEEMDWEIDGRQINKAQMTLAMLYNTLIQQEQNIKESNQRIGLTDKYGDWKEILSLINSGTGSFKDVATGIADLIRATRSPISLNNTETTKTDAWGNIKSRTYQRRY